MTQIIDRSISVSRAYLLMMRFLVPVLVVLVVFAWGLRGTEFMMEIISVLQKPWSFIVLMIPGVFLHELIHGFTWSLFGGKPISALHFGFKWKSLTPYAHMREPIPLRAYRWGAIMPAILLGFIPYGTGLLIGSPFWTLYGWLFILAASGDFVIFWLLRNDEGAVLVQDHPSRVGRVVFMNDTV